MTFTDFSLYLNKLESRSKRLEITAVLAELFGKLQPLEIQPASYLLLGSLRPAYDSLEFQMSAKMVLRSLALWRSQMTKSEAPSTDLFGSPAVGAETSVVEKHFRQLGDVGLVAEKIGLEFQSAVGGQTKVAARASAITINTVFGQLETIATQSGLGSQEQKVTQLYQLLADLDPIGAKYVCRIVVGKMRLGFSTMTMLDALSWSVCGDKSEHEQLEEAFQKRADIGYLAKVYLSAKTASERAVALSAYSVVAGTPVIPQLCQRLASPAEVIEKMGTVYAEPKYDGLRAQIHIWTEAGLKKVRVFTRSLEDVTHMFPEAVSAAALLDVDSAVFDSEAIGFNKATGELLAFQETITRKRKHDIAATAASVPIRFYIFDLLFLNGESYIDKPLRERKNVLNKTISNSEYIYVTAHLESSDPTEIQKFHESQLSQGLEGVVLKQPTAAYRGGRKGWHWVKLKELAGTRGKLKDTLDCVIMGYYSGQGKRTQFGIGAFLVGVLSGESFVTIAKIGTGLTDEQFREIKTLCDPRRSDSPSSRYEIPKSLRPTVFVDPHVVVEIAADEVTTSPMHSAGVALRFPRMVKIRFDKTPEQATTLEEVRNLKLYQP